MLKMVDGTGIIGVDMICPLGVSAPQPPNYDRVELEGTGMLVLPNSLDAPLERLELGGKTEQVSTRGVNLWSKESKITFTSTKQVVFDTPIPAGDYVVSANVATSDKDGAVCLMLFYYTDSGSKGANLTRAGRASAKITFTSDVKHVVLYAGSNANGSANDTATFADIQLEKGSTATAYEPYTGGKTSPSQEYEQDIESAGKLNTDTQKYEIVMQVKGADTELQSLTLTSDRPITKWDKLVEQGGEIGWLYKSKIDALPKTGYRYIETGFFSKGNVFTDSALNSTVTPGSQFFTCFSLANPSFKKGDIAWLYVNKPGTTDLRVRFADESINTIELFEKYMADKDIKILYETAQTEFIPLPQSEQNAIRALKTYYPTTVITADGGELDPDIKVTYRKEI